MEYATALFDHGTVQRLADDFRAVVAQVSASPQGPLPRPGVRRTAEQPREFLVDDEGYVPPESATERQLAGIWAKVLDVSRIRAQDNFFDLGGHSLLAIELQMVVHDDFGVEVPLRAMFEAPTLRELAAVVDTAVAAVGSAGTSADALPGEGAR
jgi:acyl carrier protein